MNTILRPQRWDSPFDDELGEEQVASILSLPAFLDIDSTRFPAQIPLAGIIANDVRLVCFHRGDVVVREGDYGNSAFLVVEGSVCVVLTPGIPASVLGRTLTKRRGFFSALAQLWKNRNDVPEVRHLKESDGTKAGSANAKATRVDMEQVAATQTTVQLEAGQIFGEIAAIARSPRTATILAAADATLLEIRWQGLRELRRYDTGWRERIDTAYRANALKRHLMEDSLFAQLSADELDKVAAATLFETYGSLDWNVQFKREQQSGTAKETPIVTEGDYPDGLLMIRGGFAKVTRRIGYGERVLTYLSAGSVFGLGEFYRIWKGDADVAMRSSLSPLGYVDVLRVPYFVLEKYVFPHLAEEPEDHLQTAFDRPLTADSLLKWAVDHRFINGTKSMVIDLDRCVRCDDCVSACASTHGGNPRFVRHGKEHDHWMVANACMHCIDPVCMIGCPTGAIHREEATGMVVINDETCIGCQTCANACPYDNIRMVEINSSDDTSIFDSESGIPLMKATKCDFCYDQPGGPACVRACAHDAIMRTSIVELAQIAEVR